MHIAHLWESFFRCPSKPYRLFINTQFLAQVSHSTGTFPSRAEVLKCQGPWENHGNDWNYLRTGGVGARSILGGSHHHQKGGGGRDSPTPLGDNSPQSLCRLSTIAFQARRVRWIFRFGTFRCPPSENKGNKQCSKSVDFLRTRGAQTISSHRKLAEMLQWNNYQENELLVRLSTVSFSDDLVQGTESIEGLLCLSWGRGCRILASFWVCSFTQSKISRPRWVRNWKCPSPVLQPLKIDHKKS